MDLAKLVLLFGICIFLAGIGIELTAIREHIGAPTPWVAGK